MSVLEVTACVPCFNSAHTLPRVIEALCQQTKPCREILVIDDGSIDESATVAEGLGARVLRQRTNLGRGAARARAVSECATPFVLFCDAGLALAHDFIARASGHFGEAGVAAVFGKIQRSEEGNAIERWEGRHLFRSTRAREVERSKLLNTGAALLRRDSILRAGNFNPALREAEDSDLGERLLSGRADVLFDPNLVATAIETDTLGRALERYARWNTAPGGSIPFRDYPRLISYASRVMAREDLRASDPASALISLIAPHFQFWRARLRRPA